MSDYDNHRTCAECGNPSPWSDVCGTCEVVTWIEDRHAKELAQAREERDDFKRMYERVLAEKGQAREEGRRAGLEEAARVADTDKKLRAALNAADTYISEQVAPRPDDADRIRVLRAVRAALATPAPPEREGREEKAVELLEGTAKRETKDGRLCWCDYDVEKEGEDHGEFCFRARAFLSESAQPKTVECRAWWHGLAWPKDSPRTWSFEHGSVCQDKAACEERFRTRAANPAEPRYTMAEVEAAFREAPERGGK